MLVPWRVAAGFHVLRPYLVAQGFLPFDERVTSVPFADPVSNKISVAEFFRRSFTTHSMFPMEWCYTE